MPVSVLPQVASSTLPSRRPTPTTMTTRRRSTGWLILALVTIIVLAELVLRAAQLTAVPAAAIEDLESVLAAANVSGQRVYLCG